MRRALEEDQYSANGSIVDSDSEDDEQKFVYKGNTVRLDRAFLLQTARKNNWMGNLYGSSSLKQSADNQDVQDDDEEEEEEILHSSSTGVIEGVAGSDSPSKGASGKKGGKHNKKTKGRTSGRKDDDVMAGKGEAVSTRDNSVTSSADENPMENERDEGSIFGQTTGASNSTWVECDKCKKWRRLRGVVDERKLPPKWYCSMNKNDPARARCSAPEEEYDAPQTAESAADSRTRKHLRVWVRRLQVNEQYESRQPTLTRGKKKSVTSSKEPFEWVRCCNPSCGKWRACLRIMDAKQNVVDQTSDGEWYCVMNTWDEKTASCAAPQENLPAVGLPPWCLIDES
jgi:CW-type Zinc Finger